MIRSIRPLVVAAAAVLCAQVVTAQAPKKQAPPAPVPAPAAAPTPAPPAPPPNYVYGSDGRRDPFTSLVNRGAEARTAGAASVRRPDGVPGLLTSEISVKGLVQSRGQWLALVTAPDKKVYTIKAGDRLFDGVVRSVTAQAVIILQDVNDPLSLDKQREVRKLLRGGEEVK